MNTPSLASSGKVLRWRRGVIVLVLATSGCIGRLGRSTDPFSGGSDAGTGRLSVEVQNLNFNDLTIFAIRQGQRIRLGQVTGKNDRTFSISWDFAHLVQFRIDFVGGRSCATREITVDPGGTALVQVPANLGVTPCRVSRK